MSFQALRYIPILLLLALTFSVSAINAAGAQPTGGFLVVKLVGTITSVSFENLAEALTHAENSGQVVVLLLDTPGGILDETFKIIDLIERSRVPVVGFVYPPGGRAWSAGTFILMATHVAAMAPNTIIGSAQPVSFDPLGGGSKPIEDSKVINALAKYIAERAKAHGRNEEAARRFVTENLNLDDEEAQNASVVEVRARTLGELLEMIDGRHVEVGGILFTFETVGAPVSEWGPSFRVRFLGFVSEPGLAYLMFVVGFFGLIFGLSAPGLGAEVLGGILTILGLIGLGVFGVNVGAVILMLAGFLLILAEMFIPGFGILGVGGILCVFVGSILLFPREWTVRPESLALLQNMLLVVPLVVGGLFLFVAYKVVEARRRKPLQRAIIGGVAVAVDEIAPNKVGFVRLEGELWQAKSHLVVQKGSRVRVVEKDGPMLVVEPVEGEKNIDRISIRMSNMF